MEKPSEQEPLDRLGENAQIRVEGRDYDLRAMDTVGLQTLETYLARSLKRMRLQFGLFMGEAGKDARVTPEETQQRETINVRRQQITAIQGEFSRRKTLVPPLQDFVFTAVFELYGQSGVDRVRSQAVALRDIHMNAVRRRGRMGSRRWGDRKSVCGDKIRFSDEEAAEEGLERMEDDGLDVSYMQYYPCPFCKGWHVGHKTGSGNRAVPIEMRSEA